MESYPSPSPAAIPADDQDERRRLLARLDAPGDRTLLANTILQVIRAGATGRAMILRLVRAELRRRCDDPWTDDARRARLEAFDRLLVEHQPEALDLIDHYLDWEALPPAEREQIKAQRGEAARKDWMAHQPVTDKQLAYLARLGHRGPAPANRAEASALIDRLVGGRQ